MFSCGTVTAEFASKGDLMKLQMTHFIIWVVCISCELANSCSRQCGICYSYNSASDLGNVFCLVI